MTANAVGSNQEAGCLKFDVMRMIDSNKFVLYEAYKDQASVEHH